MQNTTQICHFCKQQTPSQHSGLPELERVSCPDCGSYFADLRAPVLDSLKDPFSAEAVEMAHETLRLNKMGNCVIWSETIGDADDGALSMVLGTSVVCRRPSQFVGCAANHSRKPLDILERLAEAVAARGCFESYLFTLRDLRGLRIRGWAELFRWLRMMQDDHSPRLVEVNPARGKISGPSPDYQTIVSTDWRLTPEGYLYLEENRRSASNREVFVALSFGARKHEISSAVDRACRQSGLEARWVDKDPFVGGVMDEVLALIRRSKFVVADLTDHKNGVYYEAGFALGLGIPVIFSCFKPELDKSHFDVKHVHIVAWETTDELTYQVEQKLRTLVPELL